MKFLRYILAVAVMAVFAAGAQAQTAAEVATSVKKMESATAPCNKGPEAFKTFIQKFNTDPEFLAERLKVSDAEKEKFADILTPGNFEAKKAFAKDGDQFYQSWGEIHYNKVYLECGWVDSYVTHTFEFIRDAKGLWTLAKVVADE